MDVSGQKWAIITPNKNKIKLILDTVQMLLGKEIVHSEHTKNITTYYFDDYLSIEWYPVFFESYRGRWFHKIWCDANIDELIYNRAIYPYIAPNSEDKDKNIVWI